MPYLTALRRLTTKNLNTMRLETGTADFRNETASLCFTASEIGHMAGKKSPEALKALEELRKSGDVRLTSALTGKEAGHKSQRVWQLANIDDAVNDFYLKFS